MLSRRSAIQIGAIALAVSVRPPIVKDRILLHLIDYRQHAEDFDVPVEMTQEGIAQAVWIDVRHVVQYVRPLMEEGLVRERTAHIRGKRRRRKVYDLTEAGRSTAFQLRKGVLSETVRVRDATGIREETISQILKEAGKRIPPLEILRQHLHAGAFDVSGLEAREPTRYVEMLADAPGVDEFLGRRSELDSLTTEDDLPRIFVVRGVAGIGKSSLASKACEIRRGSQNLFWHRIRPWDTPHSVLAALGIFLSALGRPELSSILAEGKSEIAPQVMREDLPGIRATLILDDAHDASGEVLQFLRFLKDAIAEAPEVKAVVLTRRALPFYDRRDVVLDGLVSEIDLAGLEPEEIEAFVLTEDMASIPLDLIRHPLFLKLLRSSPRGAPPVEALRDVQRFIEESIYTELSEAQRRMMKIASVYRVPVPPEALFPNANLSHDVLLELTDRALITVVREEGVEVHDTIRDFFQTVVTDSELREIGSHAVPRLRELASGAGKEGNLSQCVDYLSNALQLSPSRLELLAVCEALGDAKERMGDLEGSLKAYRMAMEAAGRPEPRARLHRKMASALVSRGEIALAAAEVEDGFQELAQKVSVERGWLDFTRCQVAEWQEEWEEAKEYALAALEAFEAFSERQGETQALLFLGYIETSLPGGKPSAAREYLERALDLAHAMEDPQSSAMAHLLLAMLYALPLGDVEKATEYLSAVEPLVDTLGDSFKRINFLMVSGTIDLHLGADYGRAEALFREAMSLSRRLHSEGRLAFAKYKLAWVAYYQEKFSQARREFQQFAQDIRGRGLPAQVVEALCMAAECCLLEGNLDEFKRIKVTLGDQELSKGVEARPVMTGVFEAVDRFLRGDVEGLHHALEKAIQIDHSGLVFDPALPHIVYGAFFRAVGRDQEASEHLEAAGDMLRACSRKAQLALLPARERLLTEAFRAVART